MRIRPPMISILFLGSALAFWGITVTRSDPGITARHAAACDASHTEQKNAYCWVDKPATIVDSALQSQTTITVADGHSGNETITQGWIRLDIPPSTAPGPQIPFTQTAWVSLDPHKGDKVTARIVQGKVVSVANQRGRFAAIFGSPPTYPLMFLSAVMLAAGLAGGAMESGGCGLAVIAELILLPVVIAAVIVFYVHKSPTTMWGFVITGSAIALSALIGADWSGID